MVDETKIKTLLLEAAQKAMAKEIDPALLRPEADLRKDVGLDSLAMLETVWEIEEKLGINIPEDDMKTLMTVGDVVAKVTALTSQSGQAAGA